MNKDIRVEAVANVVATVGMLFCLYVILTFATGCTGSTGGLRFYVGYEESNQMKNEQGYTVPKKEK